MPSGGSESFFGAGRGGAAPGGGVAAGGGPAGGGGGALGGAAGGGVGAGALGSAEPAGADGGDVGAGAPDAGGAGGPLAGGAGGAAEPDGKAADGGVLCAATWLTAIAATELAAITSRLRPGVMRPLEGHDATHEARNRCSAHGGATLRIRRFFRAAARVRDFDAAPWARIACCVGPTRGSSSVESTVARFRLRFLLQEIDLPTGETVIGRSPACHVTIDDPLVSRRHAAVRITQDKAVVEDLGARNGLQVNGKKIDGTQGLVDGDRIRIGTQELVFCTVEPQQERAGTRPTGYLCRCASCGAPYPAEAAQCPQCGSAERLDEETLSGVVSKSEQNWTLQLLVEVLERAVDLARWGDVERILRRSKANVEERLAAEQPVDRGHLDIVADAAVRLAVAQGEARWAKWTFDIYNAARLVPKADIAERVSTLPPSERSSVLPSADKLVRGVRERGGPTSEDRESFAALESLNPPRE